MLSRLALFGRRKRRLSPETRKAKHILTWPGIAPAPAGLEILESRTLLAFTVTPVAETAPVPHSGDAADDVAVWVHPVDASLSTIIGSDKDGGLAVYDLLGNEIQYVSIGSVNNVDLRHNFPLGGESVDLVVGSNRTANVLAVYKVNPLTRMLEEVSARPLESALGEIYGLTMYRSPVSGGFYAFTSDRDDGRVEQWELFDDGAGKVDGRIVRTFDAGGTVEGMVADDETGALYAGEETGGLWKYSAEPTAGTDRIMLDTTDDGGRLTADLEGLAIYYAAGGAGYLLVSNQGANEFMIYDRQTGAFIDRFKISSGLIDGVNDTDGIDVLSFGLGPIFPSGLFIAQDYSNNDGNQNFKLVNWADIAGGATPALIIDPTQNPRMRGGLPTTPPAAPTGLSATAVSARRVDLAWTDNSDNEFGFRIERSTDRVTWIRAGFVSGSSFSDTTAPPDSTLHYRVLAAGAAGDSVPSNVATAVTPAEVPTTAMRFVADGSFWKYLNNGTDLGSAWIGPDFDDSAWPGGPAQLGYGDGDESTVIGGGTPSFITSYFRRAFEVADPGAIQELTLQLLRDDGAVVYLNGIEVVRSNMPSGAITYSTGSAASVGPAVENSWHSFTIDPGAVVAGRNVLAVEVHQVSSSSGDLSFDLRLDGRAIDSGEEWPPAAPSGLTATVVATDRVELSWDDNSGNETGFRIERSDGGAAWAAVATVGANVTTHQDGGLSAGSSYSYRVIAVNAVGESTPSGTVAVTMPAPSNDVTLVSQGSPWKYLDDGSDQGTAWRGVGFDDAGWASGPGQLGYGDGDEATVIGTRSDHITTYFRRAFSVPEPAAYLELTLKLLRDDGAVVYLNGVEALRSNMPATGLITHTTTALELINREKEDLWHTFALSPSLLVSGTNVLAVEVHQDYAGSSDVSFDLELRGVPSAPIEIPAAPSNLLASTVSSSQIDLVWSDNSGDESGFVIEWSTGGSSWAELARTSAGVTTYHHSGLPAATTFEYRVRAFNSAGSSAASNVASATTAPSGEIVYSGPLVITRGGTYSGNWESLDAGVPAVTVSTTEPVVIENANIRGKGVLIKASVYHTNLTVRNTRGYGMNPNVYGVAAGRFLEAERFDNVVVENNYLEGTGGIVVADYIGDFTTANTVRIVGNSVLNIDGRLSDGAGGYLDFDDRTRLSDGVKERGYAVRQFVRLSRVQSVPGIEIAWNQVINEPGNSRVDDNISIYKSRGTASSPIRIHDNYIQGAYTVQPWRSGTTTDGVWEYDWNYGGGGILLGDGNGGTAYVQAYDNQVISTTNYGIAIAQGNDVSFYGNRVVASGRLPDGRMIGDMNVGVYIWDFYNTGLSFYNNSAYNNLVGWVTDADGGRNDWWVPDASIFENNTRWPGEITLQTEANEFTYWQYKLAASGVPVGPWA